MPQVLTTNALITCPHMGVGQTIPSAPKWQVNGGFVAVEGDTGTLTCTFVPPCVGYTLRSMGLNATTIDGRKVILITDFNQSFTGLPLKITEFHQTYDDSTPSPIAPGGSAPPLSPELLDSAPPVITVAPAALPFNTMTSIPPLHTVIFTLLSPFPMQWQMALLSVTPPTSTDVTNGMPPGLVLAPAGGAWSAPLLNITMTLTAPFMAGLGPGLHYFYLTGVSQRGLSASAQCTLTVT